jgi:hydrogenase maturation protease
MKTLILGIGNLLMGDEGVGIHVVRHLQDNHKLPGIDIVDGGTGGFHLLEYFQNYGRVILVDATMDGKPPGNITLLKPKYSSDYPQTLTAHDIGLKDLLDSLYLLNKQPEIVLFAISISGLGGLNLELSEELQPAVEKAAEAIIKYLNDTET